MFPDTLPKTKASHVQKPDTLVEIMVDIYLCFSSSQIPATTCQWLKNASGGEMFLSVPLTIWNDYINKT